MYKCTRVMSAQRQYGGRGLGNAKGGEKLDFSIQTTTTLHRRELQRKRFPPTTLFNVRNRLESSVSLQET